MTRKTPVLLTSALVVGLSGAALAQNLPSPPEPAAAQTLVQDKKTASTAEAGPGPMAGWNVYSLDGQLIGTVSFSAVTAEGMIDYVIFALENGNKVKMDGSNIARLGDGNLMAEATAADIAANAKAGVTELGVTHSVTIVTRDAEGNVISAEKITN